LVAFASLRHRRTSLGKLMQA